MGLIAYVFDLINATLCSVGIFSHFLPAMRANGTRRRARCGKWKPKNKTAGMKPAVRHSRCCSRSSHRFDGSGEPTLVARGLVLVDDLLVGNAIDNTGGAA